MWRKGSIAIVLGMFMLLGLVGSAFADGPQFTFDPTGMTGGRQITLNAERVDVGLGQVDTNAQSSPARDRASALSPNKINRVQTAQVGWLLFTALVLIGISLPIAVSRAVRQAASLQSIDASRQVESELVESQEARVLDRVVQLPVAVR